MLVEERVVSIGLRGSAIVGIFLSVSDKHVYRLTSLPVPLKAKAQSYGPFALNPNPFQTTEPFGARKVPPVSIAPLSLYCG